MKTNMGKIDKTVRVVIAVAIAILYLANVITGTWAIVLLVVAVAFVVTSFIGFCPLYAPFGISTQKRSSKTT